MNKYIKYGIAVCYTIFVLIVSILPQRFIAVDLNFSHSDKVLHGIGFMILGFLLGIVFLHRSFFTKWIWIAVTVVLSEFLQFFSPERTPDMYDMVADIIGSIIGLHVCAMLLLHYMHMRAVSLSEEKEQI